MECVTSFWAAAAAALLVACGGSAGAASSVSPATPAEPTAEPSPRTDLVSVDPEADASVLLDALRARVPREQDECWYVYGQSGDLDCPPLEIRAGESAIRAQWCCEPAIVDSLTPHRATAARWGHADERHSLRVFSGAEKFNPNVWVSWQRGAVTAGEVVGLAAELEGLARREEGVVVGSVSTVAMAVGHIVGDAGPPPPTGLAPLRGQYPPGTEVSWDYRPFFRDVIARSARVLECTSGQPATLDFMIDQGGGILGASFVAPRGVTGLREQDCLVLALEGLSAPASDRGHYVSLPLPLRRDERVE